MNVSIITAIDPANGMVVPLGVGLTQEAAEFNAEELKLVMTLPEEVSRSIRVVPAVLIFDESSFHG